eukprot:SAG25_NODE_2104_length_1947_cov_1.295455_3_plen_130_part_00
MILSWVAAMVAMVTSIPGGDNDATHTYIHCLLLRARHSCEQQELSGQISACHVHDPAVYADPVRGTASSFLLDLRYYLPQRTASAACSHQRVVDAVALRRAPSQHPPAPRVRAPPRLGCGAQSDMTRVL